MTSKEDLFSVFVTGDTRRRVTPALLGRVVRLQLVPVGSVN